MILALVGLLAGAAAAPQQLKPCQTAATILAAAKVTQLAVDPSALDLRLEAKGLAVSEADEVAWPTCPVQLQSRVYGGWAITDNGIPVMPMNSHLITRDDEIYPPAPEPDHPKLAGAQFLSSTSLFADTLRAGLWRDEGGRYVVASYRPGQIKAPRPIMSSSLAILGLFYLGAPDSRGGQFLFWQQLPNGKYRFLRASWSEEGLR